MVVPHLLPILTRPKKDVLSYIVSSGLVDLLASQLSSPRQADSLLRTVSTPPNGGGSRGTSGVGLPHQFVFSSVSLLHGLVSLLGRIQCNTPTRAHGHPFGEYNSPSDLLDTQVTSSQTSTTFGVLASVESLNNRDQSNVDDATLRW